MSQSESKPPTDMTQSTPEGWELLSQEDEDALHARRLLNIEVKNYDRVKRHVKDFIDRKKNLAQPPTFSDDIDDTTKQAALDEFKQSQANESKAAKEDLNMELQAYKAYIRRTQFLLNQNEEERKRYEDKKKTLTDKISEIRKANEALRERLAAAQQKRETREKYDKLAETITSKPHLKPREEQRATNEKLQAEIDELDHEHTEYTRVWSDRREQFSRIVDQGQQLLRSIKDEKEEAERKEGLDDMGESARDTPQLEELALAPGATENEDQGSKTPDRGVSGLKEAARANQEANEDVKVENPDDVVPNEQDEVESGEETENVQPS